MRTFALDSPARWRFHAAAWMLHWAMTARPSTHARRSADTETAIMDAFVALAIERRYDAIRVADLITRSGVGRSTFYEHFKGKDDVLLMAMRPILLALSTAASGRAAHSYVRSMVEHLWERRSLARPILDSKAASILQRRLADAIAGHGGGQADAAAAPLFAAGIAAAQLAMLRCWLTGHAPATIDVMTDHLIACSRLRDGSSRP